MHGRLAAPTWMSQKLKPAIFSLGLSLTQLRHWRGGGGERECE